MTRKPLLILAGVGLLTSAALVCSCTTEEAAPQAADLLTDQANQPPSLSLVAQGLEVDGELLVPGGELHAVEQLLGPAETIRAMGLAGRFYGYGSLGLEFQSDGKDQAIAAIHLFVGFPGTAPLGAAPGVTETALTDRLGEGTVDPFGVGRFYPAEGLTVGLAQEAVTTVTLTTPWE